MEIKTRINIIFKEILKRNSLSQRSREFRFKTVFDEVGYMQIIGRSSYMVFSARFLKKIISQINQQLIEVPGVPTSFRQESHFNLTNIF